MPRQRYVSNELTHFLGRREADDDARYALLLKMLGSGLLTPYPLDPSQGNMSRVDTTGKLSDESMYLGRVTCFCDIPLADLEIHMTKYSRFGIAFDKQWLVSRGANPVFYVVSDPGLPRPKSFERAIQELTKKMQDFGLAEVDMAELVSKVQIFDEFLPLHHQLFAKIMKIAQSQETDLGASEVAAVEGFHDTHIGLFLKPFSTSLPDEHPENVYMEREWRILGNLQFALDDVVRVILPKQYRKRFREDSPHFYGQVHFPDEP